MRYPPGGRTVVVSTDVPKEGQEAIDPRRSRYAIQKC